MPQFSMPTGISVIMRTMPLTFDPNMTALNLLVTEGLPEAADTLVVPHLVGHKPGAAEAIGR